MLWKIAKLSHLHVGQVLLFLFAAFVLAGCASSPWTNPLKGTEADSIARQIDALTARDALCGKTIEGDLVLFYQSPLGKKALDGFFQFSMPSAYKFVVTNPFGQPVLVIAGDKEYFQVINTLKKQFLTEKLSSFGLRNDIPSSLLKSDWSSLLTGRFQLSSRSITDIRNDRDARGVWLTFQNNNQAGVSHLLLDREKEIFLVYILEGGNGKKIAEITYGKRLPADTCHQPLEINIAGLDYGTEIHITLDNVILNEEKKTFQLHPPPGYTRQYMP